ncbi:MAG: peptidoglycan bridge formation glycyltransferase FemA/FemB family protein, partial [Clostridia bacterium]
AKENNAYMLTIDPDIAEDSHFCRNLRLCGFKLGDNMRDNGLLQPLAVFRIDIAGKTDDDLLAMFHSKARYSVRASLKSGATCRIGVRDDIPAFQKLLCETAKRDGFTPRGVEYFNNMFDALAPDYCKLFIVEYDGEMIAGSVLIRYGDKTWHLYGASSENHKDTLPNFLMQWEMMRWSIAEGCTMYDMRGVAGEQDKTRPLEGLMRFKKRFGGELLSFAGRLDIVYKPTVYKATYAARRMKDTLRHIIGKGR